MFPPSILISQGQDQRFNTPPLTMFLLSLSHTTPPPLICILSFRYKTIASHPTTLEIYEEQLIGEGVVSKEDCERGRAAGFEGMGEELEGGNKKEGWIEHDVVASTWLASNWQGGAIGSLLRDRPYNTTGVPARTLRCIGHAATEIPFEVTAHADVEALFAKRRAMMQPAARHGDDASNANNAAHAPGVDMAMAEVLAFGSLMLPLYPNDPIARRPSRGAASDGDGDGDGNSSGDGNGGGNETARAKVDYQAHPTVHVRLSGQDSVRGTFSQRHAAVYDQNNNRAYWPLNNMGLGRQASLRAMNSSLSEAAALGFEYGFSLANENALVLWEAQFGDFANVAQVRRGDG